MQRAIDLYTLNAGSRLRQPDWRWALARRLVDAKPPSAPHRRIKHPDRDVVAAGDMMQLVEGDMPESARLEGLDRAGHHKSDAYVFHHRGIVAASVDPPNGSDDYPLTGPLTADAVARAQLEALVLADRPAESIAKIANLSPEAVTQYEKWWFDVRDRLKSPGWVATNVIGSLQQGTPALLLPALIRAYGYYTKSSRIVRAVSGLFDGPAARQAARDPTKFFSQDALAAGGLKAALAVRLLPLTRKTYARMIELHGEATSLSLKAGESVGSEDERRFRDAARQLFDNVEQGYRKAPVEEARGITPPRLMIPAAGGDAG